MSPELARELEGLLEENAAHADAYTVEAVLKETEAECTELVRSADGTCWVRKLFCRDDPSIERAYRAIQGSGSPCLPRIHDLQRSAAGTVVVREYVPGPTLREWVETHGPLDDNRARGLLVQVCRGAQALHSCNPPLVHRDVNPSNVILAPDGPHLIDFGIARAYDEDASHDTHAWGTTGYAAPEQFGFGQSDARTDVFGLGMLYWFMLTGTDPEADLGTRLRRNGASTSVGARVPEGAREIVRTCVAISPEDRYQSVEELVGALGATTAESAGPDPAAGAPHASADSTNAEDARPRWTFRRVCARAWTIASSCFMGFLALAVIATLVEPWRLSVPQGWAHALVFCLGLAFMFAPTWLLSTNLFRVRERLPFLRGHTFAKCALICAICFVTGAYVANAATMDLPAAYVQLMQEQGQSTI